MTSGVDQGEENPDPLSDEEWKSEDAVATTWKPTVPFPMNDGGRSPS